MDTRVNSIFGAYSQQLQVLVDTNLEKFKAPFYNRFFQLGLPTTNLTYATVIGKSRIEAAASVVAHGSEAPLRSRAGLERLSGEVSAIKVKRQLDEQEYRNWLTLQGMNVSDEGKKMQIIKLIWDDLKYVVDSVQQRMDLMAARALSKGIIDIDATSNPDGVVPGDIDLLVTNKIASDAFTNTTDANRRWLSSTPTTAKPISDIIYTTRKYSNEKGLEFEKILMTPTKLWQVLATTEVTNSLKGFLNVESGNGYIPSLGALNTLLTANNLPIIELVDVRGRIEKNGVMSSYNGWADDKYITFIPGGQLGVMHNALSVEQISPVSTVDYATANNILVSKWSQTEPFGEFTRGEIAAFPGLEMADQLVLVNTEHQTIF